MITAETVICGKNVHSFWASGDSPSADPVASNLIWLKTQWELLKETISLVMLPKVMKLQSRDDCLQHHLLSEAGSVPSSEKQHPSFSGTHFIRAVHTVTNGFCSSKSSHWLQRKCPREPELPKTTIYHRLMLSNTLIFLQLLLFKNGQKIYCWWSWVIQQSAASQRLWTPLWPHWKMGRHWKGLSVAWWDWACPG